MRRGRSMSAPTADARARASSWTKGAALAAAGVVSLGLTFDPYALQGLSPTRVHIGLPLLLLGVSAGFVYGFGFRPENAGARAFCHPATAAALFVVGALVLAAGAF